MNTSYRSQQNGSHAHESLELANFLRARNIALTCQIGSLVFALMCSGEIKIAVWDARVGKLACIT